MTTHCPDSNQSINQFFFCCSEVVVVVVVVVVVLLVEAVLDDVSGLLQNGLGQ
jgi:hypothetical protein